MCWHGDSGRPRSFAVSAFATIDMAQQGPHVPFKPLGALSSHHSPAAGFICNEKLGSVPAFLAWKGARHDPKASFQANSDPRGRLADEEKCLREQASRMPPSVERERLLRKARQDEIALHFSEWLRSPGLRAPQ